MGGDDPALKDMTKENVIPRLGYFLRALIKAGGYRGHLVGIGLDKDLDDLALEAKDRQGTIAELMEYPMERVLDVSALPPVPAKKAKAAKKAAKKVVKKAVKAVKTVAKKIAKKVTTKKPVKKAKKK